MNIEFEIVWDGEIEGLSEHRVRLGVFSEALSNLSKALQWTASALLSEGEGEIVGKDYGLKGQPKAEARALDFDLVSLGEGSARLGMAPYATVLPGETRVLFDTLVERATKRFIDDIEREHQGNSTSATVHRLIESIPSGLTKHKYSLTIDGTLYKSVDFAQKEAPNLNRATSGLQTLNSCFIAGFAFEPGPYQVRLRSEVGKGPIYTLEATRSLVSTAEKLRGQMVNALCLHQAGQRPRLLWLRNSIGDNPLTPEERLEHINGRWSNVLKRLAE